MGLSASMPKRSIRDLRPHQLEGSDFVFEGDDSLLLMPVGTGKTITILHALDRMKKKGLFTRGLILAPKRVAQTVWPYELAEWEHNWDLRCVSAVGNDKKRLLTIENSGANLISLNYDVLPWLLRMYRQGELPFDLVVYDELDKMKDPSTERFRLLKNRVPEFKVRIGATGTFVPESLLDAFGESYVVTGGAALGRFFEAYKQEYFEPADYGGWKYKPKRGATKKILDKLDDWIYTVDESVGNLPELMEHTVWTDLPPKARKDYDDLESTFLLTIERDGLESFDLQVTEQAVLRQKLRQMASGFVYYYPEGEEGPRETAWHSKAKLEVLDDFLGELQGRQALVVYGFRAELEALRAKYKDRLRYLGGGVSDHDAAQTIEEWNAGRLPILAVHPASAGHGLNLQKSGACNIIFLTEPYSSGMHKQVIGRLKRSGQSASTVFVHYIRARDTVDEDVANALKAKGDFQDAVVRSLKERQAARSGTKHRKGRGKVG